jgi:DNA (cytosine-5)-methyltransferase 3A
MDVLVGRSIKVLSLFDGISCGRVALERAGIACSLYAASETDKYAIQVSQKNYPDIVRYADVRGLSFKEGDFDLVIGGPPCQDLSIAKNGRQGLSGPKSSLFWEYVRILKEVKPKWFVMENVSSMSRESRITISQVLGVDPIGIDAARVSGQMRRRLFWTNIHVTELPPDRGIMLKDILLPDTYTERDKAHVITATYGKGCNLYHSLTTGQRTMVWNKPIRVGRIGSGNSQGSRVYSIDGKSVTLCANGGGLGAKTGLYQIKDYARKLHPIECERLQGLQDGYTEGISKTQRYKTLGNAFNVDVVAWILKHLQTSDIITG